MNESLSSHPSPSSSSSEEASPDNSASSSIKSQPKARSRLLGLFLCFSDLLRFLFLCLSVGARSVTPLAVVLARFVARGGLVPAFRSRFNNGLGVESCVVCCMLRDVALDGVRG